MRETITNKCLISFLNLTPPLGGKAESKSARMLMGNDLKLAAWDSEYWRFMWSSSFTREPSKCPFSWEDSRHRNAFNAAINFLSQSSDTSRVISIVRKGGSRNYDVSGTYDATTCPHVLRFVINNKRRAILADPIEAGLNGVGTDLSSVSVNNLQSEKLFM